MFNYNHLYYFYMVAKAGGATAAARRLHTSQPSLSIQLKNLEATLEKPLFLRQGRKMVLTPEGRTLYSYCDRIFTLGEEAWESLHGDPYPSEYSANYVRLGVSSDVERPFIAILTGRFLANTNRSKLVRVRLTSIDPENMVSELANGNLDACIGAHRIFDPGIKELRKINLPVVCVCSPSISKNLKGMTLSDLMKSITKCKYNWVLPCTGARLRIETDRYFESRHFSPRVVFESDVLAAVLRAAEENMGLALLPKAYVEEALVRGTLVIKGDKQGLWNHTIYLYSRKELTTLTVIQALREVFVASLGRSR